MMHKFMSLGFFYYEIDSTSDLNIGRESVLDMCSGEMNAAML